MKILLLSLVLVSIAGCDDRSRSKSTFRSFIHSCEGGTVDLQQFVKDGKLSIQVECDKRN